LDRPKEGCIVIIAHRISDNDLPGHVLQKGGWKHLKLPLIAMRSRTYDLGAGELWKRKKGELLRPDAFTKQDIRRLRDSRQPGFETLQQQNPGGRDRLRIKAEFFPAFSPADVPMPHSPVVLSIEPGQKGGAANSYSVIQAWAPSVARIVCSTNGGSKQAIPNFVRKFGCSFGGVGRAQY
jgi:hypothetical protein